MASKVTRFGRCVEIWAHVKCSSEKEVDGRFDGQQSECKSMAFMKKLYG